MNIRIGVLIILIVGILSYLFGTHKFTSPVAPRIIDRCPTQRRPPQTKSSARIQQNGHEWNVINDPFVFRFSFPDAAWRFEENTLQDREEPISTPGYLYTFMLAFGGTYDVSRRAPADIRMLVYTSLCNTPQQWAQFFVTQGWGNEREVTFVDSGIPWTLISRDDSGRKTRMYMTNKGIFQYAFILSSDTTVPNISEEDMLSIVKKFQFMEGAPDETP